MLASESAHAFGHLELHAATRATGTVELVTEAFAGESTQNTTCDCARRRAGRSTDEANLGAERGAGRGATQATGGFAAIFNHMDEAKAAGWAVDEDFIGHVGLGLGVVKGVVVADLE